MKNVTCIQCHKFKVPKGCSKYCSKSCRDLVVYSPVVRKIKLVSKKCNHCNKDFEYSSYQHTREYCSTSCASTHYSERRKYAMQRNNDTFISKKTWREAWRQFHAMSEEQQKEAIKSIKGYMLTTYPNLRSKV